MNADCQHMTEMIHKLKEDITECMLRKFSGEIDLDELEEAILRRLVAQIKSSTKDIKKAYERRILEMQVVMSCRAQSILYELLHYKHYPLHDYKLKKKNFLTL
jgi:hypothetical protein